MDKYERIRIAPGVGADGKRVKGSMLYAKNPTEIATKKLGRMVCFERVDREGALGDASHIVSASLISKRTRLRMNPAEGRLENADAPLEIPEWASDDLRMLMERYAEEART